MNIENSITFVVGVITILSAIYKLAQIEANIKTSIASSETKNFLMVDNLKNNLSERLTNTDRKLDIHLQDYTNYKDAVLVNHNGLADQIRHNWNKTERLLTKDKNN